MLLVTPNAFVVTQHTQLILLVELDGQLIEMLTDFHRSLS